MDLTQLSLTLHHFAGLSDEDFAISKNLWQEKSYKKGEVYNSHKSICRHLGFITSGAFRSYTLNEETGEEKNVFLYSSNGFVVAFKSFINQIPCDYHTQSLTDSTVIFINIIDLQQLYQKSHAWEKFGRLLAQEAFNLAMSRIEGFIFKSPEERYLELLSTGREILQRMPQHYIANYLGITPVSLSRIRKRILETVR